MIVIMCKEICKAIGVANHLPQEWKPRLLSRARVIHPLIKILSPNLGVGPGHHHRQTEIVGDVDIDPLPRSCRILHHDLALPELMSSCIKNEIPGPNISQGHHHRQ